MTVNTDKDGTIRVGYFNPAIQGVEPLFVRDSKGVVSFFDGSGGKTVAEGVALSVEPSGVKVASLETDKSLLNLDFGEQTSESLTVQNSVWRYNRDGIWVSVNDFDGTHTYARIPVKEGGGLYDTWRDASGRIVVGDKKENVVKFVQVDLTVQNAATDANGSELTISTQE